VVFEVQWSVRDRGSYGGVLKDCPLQCNGLSLVVLGKLRTAVRFGELHLVSQIVAMAIYSRVWTIRWWSVVRGASRHSCSKDRSVYSSKGVESRGV